MKKYLLTFFLLLGVTIVLGFLCLGKAKERALAEGGIDYSENVQFSRTVEDLMLFASKKMGLSLEGIPKPNVSVISEDQFSIYFRASYKRGAKFTYHHFSERIVTYQSVLEDSYVVRSFLVHEIVHHLQHYRMDMRSLDCLSLAEVDAYHVMRDYVKLYTSKHNKLIDEWVDKNKSCNGDSNPYRNYPSLNLRYQEYLDQKNPN